MTKKVIKMMLNNTGCVQDEKNQLLTTCMWFNLVWTDYQLSWNTSEYGGVDSVVIQPRNLWIPDILLYNRYSTVQCSTVQYSTAPQPLDT